MIWEWDREKNRANLRIHGIEFETAILVFDDPLAATYDDPYPYERRWRTIGIIEGLLILVVHTWPEDNSDTGSGERAGRIISARPATPYESRSYEEGHV